MIYVKIEKKIVMINYTNRKKKQYLYQISDNYVIHWLQLFIICKKNIPQVIFLQRNTPCDLYSVAK